jgi:hypothetical protein
MITGGLAAKAGGGSFEDGAVQAGMVHLYNAWGTIKEHNQKPLACKSKAFCNIFCTALFFNTDFGTLTPFGV